MNYFKHSEIVDEYKVSLKTIHNWIDASKQGKLELQLHELNGRTYVANTPANVLVLEKLADKGKKYRNTLHQKVVTPTPQFYETYSPRQILDIIENLTIHHEIPQQYNYLDGGATRWSDWMDRLQEEDQSSTLKGTMELIGTNLEAIDRLLRNKRKINVIDVGVGTALPGKQLVEYLLKQGRLNRYIALDISQSMLDIAERNINKWFDGKVKFEGYVRDISFERFDDLIVDDGLGEGSEDVVNVVLVLGATAGNFRFPVDVLRVIYNSMGSKDILLYTRKPDTPRARRYFDFNTDKSDISTTTISPLFTLVLEMLNIDSSLYEPVMGFDEKSRMRYIQIKLKTALTIRFRHGKIARDVSFEKGDTVLLLRIWHQTVLEQVSQFEDVGFALLHSTLTQDREYLMTISGVAVDAK